MLFAEVCLLHHAAHIGGAFPARSSRDTVGQIPVDVILVGGVGDAKSGRRPARPDQTLIM